MSGTIVEILHPSHLKKEFHFQNSKLWDVTINTGMYWYRSNEISISEHEKRYEIRTNDITLLV